MTFSKSLGEYLCSLCPGATLRRVSFLVGAPLSPGQPTQVRLFAIVSRKTEVVLRISLIRELAEELIDDTRYAAECWLV